MLSRFRRPEADMRIELDRETLRPGDEVEARVTLAAKSNFQVRQGTVDLVCKEIYVQRISTQHGTHYHKRTETLSRAGQTFTENAGLRRGVTYSSKVNLVVPTDALPTISGERFHRIDPGIFWEVEVALDVANARDIKGSEEVTVVKPDLAAAPPRPVVEEAEHRQCVMTLEVSSTEARSGDRLEGSFRVETLQDVAVSGIRIDLIRHEKFGNEGKDHEVDRIPLESETTLESGRVMEWPFRLDVGKVVAPSLETEKSSVEWLVKGVLDRRMRPDLRVEREIAVDF